MEDFSIESQIANIHDPRTRSYFREVFSSYHNENYRSAVVMLWSVVICDLIYKLQDLQDIEKDPISTKILETIKDRQVKNPKSPEWEPELLRLIRERTELLDQAEFDELNHLQGVRHMSAHPVLSNVDLLYRPNKDSARALIRSGLEGVLLKPPILTKKVFIRLIEDLANKRDILIDYDSLRHYIESRYIRNLQTPTIAQVFRHLWKFVFHLEDLESEVNRDINFRALSIIYDLKTQDLRTYVKDNSGYFSEMAAGKQLENLLIFLEAVINFKRVPPPRSLTST
jgi:hypothetical protein